MTVNLNIQLFLLFFFDMIICGEYFFEKYYPSISRVIDNILIPVISDCIDQLKISK